MYHMFKYIGRRVPCLKKMCKLILFQNIYNIFKGTFDQSFDGLANRSPVEGMHRKLWLKKSPTV